MLKRFNDWQADFFFGLDSMDELATSDKVIWYGWPTVGIVGILAAILI